MGVCTEAKAVKRLKANITMDRVITFLIVDPESERLLVQKRSPDRRLFPNRWEIPGGHMEPDEDITTCIKRELKEELSLSLLGIIGKIHEFEWDDAGTKVHNEAYLVIAQGQVALEKGKATDCMWIDKSQIGILLPPGKDTGGPYEAAKKAFEWLAANAKCMKDFHGKIRTSSRIKNFIVRALLWGALDPQQGAVVLDDETLKSLFRKCGDRGLGNPSKDDAPKAPSATDVKPKGFRSLIL